MSMRFATKQNVGENPLNYKMSTNRLGNVKEIV